MIEIITYKERDPKTGKEIVLVSHGVNTDTGKNVCLPQEKPESIGAKYSNEFGWYLEE